MTISCWIFLRMRNISDKIAEKIKTHILCSITFPQKQCHLWDNVEKYSTARQATDDNTIWCMHFACCITKATDAHSEYVILIAFPRQQRVQKRTSICYMYIACLVLKQNNSYTQIPTIWYFSRLINTSEFLRTIHVVIKLKHSAWHMKSSFMYVKM
jgi:hypothetical protein